MNDKLAAFKDQVSSQLASADFMIISDEEVLKSMQVYPTEMEMGELRSARQTTEVAVATAKSGGSSATSGAGRSVTEATFDTPKHQNLNPNRNSLGSLADRLLSDQSSALRMAQNMGAEYMLFVTVGSLSTREAAFNNARLGLKGKSTTYTLRGTYKLTEAYRTGGAIAGGPIKSDKVVPSSDAVQIKDDGILNELLEEGAAQVVAGMTEKVRTLPRPQEPTKVNVTIASYAKDLAGNEISLPDLRLTEGKVAGSEQSFPALVSATVKIDGFALGVTPVTLKLLPGPHKLQLERPGFKPIDMHFLAQEGVTLAPTMWMHEEGFGRWKSIREFLNGLDTKRQLTQAEVKVLEGHAQMLRQSGFLVDIRKNSKEEIHVKEDIKVDTKEAPKQNVFIPSFWNYWRGR
ncbi:MAG: PEGA domain-containing protein [Verrucomicrobia bacterium]|nr:PEGA domain-containing protein [Verrucomicrobiota bacterium]